MRATKAFASFNPETPPPHGDFPYPYVPKVEPRPQSGFGRIVVNIILVFVLALIVLVVIFFLSLRPLRLVPTQHAYAAPLLHFVRDDGRYADSPLKSWFDQLASGKGLCCSFADGFQIEDVDWEAQNGRYRVRIHGEWVDVPDNALVTEPNKFGPAVVWPYMDSQGATQIRCFMPGAGA